jgi:hypothetical protein
MKKNLNLNDLIGLELNEAEDILNRAGVGYSVAAYNGAKIAAFDTVLVISARLADGSGGAALDGGDALDGGAPAVAPEGNVRLLTGNFLTKI